MAVPWHGEIHKFQTSLELVRTSLASKMHKESMEERKEEWIKEVAKIPKQATLEQVHFVETGPFCSLFEWSNFKPGPNTSAGESNTVQFLPRIEESTNTHHPTGGSVLQLSGGTDWSGFQGIYSTFDRLYPTFLEFTISVDDSNINCGSLALATSVRTWGLFGICFHFRAENGHWRVQKNKLQWENICPAEANVSTDVRVDFDWKKCEQTIRIGEVTKTLNIGGITENEGINKPLGVIAFYNTRKLSVSRFSNVILSSSSSSHNSTKTSCSRFPVTSLASMLADVKAMLLKARYSTSSFYIIQFIVVVIVASWWVK